MNRKSVAIIGALLAIFVGWAIVAGNRLPGELRAQVLSEQKHLAETRRQIADEQASVAKDAAGEPELFHVRGFDQEWPGRFHEAEAALGEAGRYGAALDPLLRKNNRGSAAEVRDLLQREREREAAASKEAGDTLKEAQKRLDFKKNYAATLTGIASRAKALEAADYSAVTKKVTQAEQDWPSKKDVLQTRLNALLDPKKQASAWEQSAQALAAKPDYAQALDLEESVDHAPGPAQAAELAGLSAQLYTSWDNVLEDLDKDNDIYREKVKHVVTTVTAPNAKGSTSSTDTWSTVSPDQWRVVQNDIGMTVAHKPLGRFDSEADHTPEPAGFAYMASPAEGRNQYGYWDHREGGSVWTWLPEYLILRDLLSHHSYQPIPSYDWDRYRQAQRYGQTYYGRDESGAPKYGSHGTFTLQHYGNSRYAQSGGFSGSKYASGGGGFSGSKYGSGSASASPSAASSGSHRYGTSSGSRFGSGSRSAGRSFGGRRH